MNAFRIGVAVLIGTAGVASAQLDLRVDLSNFVSTTAGNWNNISNLTGTTNDLVDFPTGANSGVSITGAGPWLDFFGDDNGAFPDQDWVIRPATQDGAGLDQGETGTFTFANLGDGPYRVEVVSARTTFQYLNFITVEGNQADRTYLGTPVATPWNSTTDGLDAGNWLIWDDVVPVRGTLTIMNIADVDTLGMLNAIRIYQVPAPGTAGILGLAVLAAARRRR